MQTCRALFTGLILIGACSSSGSTTKTASASTSASTNVVKRGTSNLITESEVASMLGQADNAYDLVDRLRPTMMRARANTQQGEAIPVKAAVDDRLLGDLTQLRTVPASQVKEIRYLSGTDATQRWGTGFISGAIQVITKR